MIYKSLDDWNKLLQDAHYVGLECLGLEFITDEKCVNAMGELADMYYAGTFIEIKRDFDKAYEWYTKAAKLGHIPSIRTLGNSYQDGYGVKKDVEEARKWFEKGRELGDDYCKKRLDRLNREKNDENTNS
jgi:uncharacterized protein